MFQIGEKFGDYEVLQILGAGGMGQVFKVRNTISDRFEAMKVLLPSLEQHADLADRFLREIKVQATLQHKNIAGLHTAQRQSDRILMFIEFVDGITLDKALQRGSLSPELAATIIGQVLEALAYAHGRGVVHRDIKPENIMVQPDGSVKLMDFGIARLAQDRRLTGTGRTVGSLFYMSPEQIRGADDLDNRSDLYSLGITLYQCVTGKRPFEGDSDYSIMSAHIQQIPVPPVQLDPRVPASLNDVIMKAIAKDRNARFQSADAFRSELLASVSGSSVPLSNLATPTPEVTRTPAEAPTVPRGQMPPPPPVTPVYAAPAIHQQHPLSSVGGKKGLWLGIGVLAAAGLGGFAYYRTSAAPTLVDPVKTPGPKPEPPPTTVPMAKLPVEPVTEPAAKPPAAKPAAKRDPGPAQPSKNSPVETPTPVAARQDPSPAASPAQQPVPAVKRTYPPSEPANPSSVDPQVQREMEELRQKYNALSTRFAVAQESVRGMEQQQQRRGLAMRRDVREGIQRFQYLMKESADSLTSRNTEAARNGLNMAERNLDRLEKFLGN